ncbi:LamG-like jellyroll fold domain-containing protein [Lacipirellula sp.]|uniref:LamG domain-containing protein n=1 Tax=Lacipirellula sp. TaxID=2691419 RepID=UPI003D09B280
MAIRTFCLSLAAVATLSNSASAALKHLYTFNDGTVTDSVGGANGTLEAGAVVVAGQLTLSGSGQFANLPAATIGINAYTKTTLELWVNAAPASNNQFTMAAAFGRHGNAGAGEDANLGYDYIMVQPTRGGGELFSRVAITDGTYSEETGVNGSILAGTGQKYLAVTIDSAGVDNTTLSYYINGALIGTANGTDDLADVGNAVAYLGKSVYANDPYFTGSINEFRIHDTILTPAQIAASSTAGPAGLAGPTLTINRDTGAVTLSNQQAAIQVFSYSITSASGGLNPASWTTVAGHFDSAGNGSFDSNDVWSTTALTKTAITEEEPFGDGGAEDGGTLGTVTFSTNGGWIKSFREDVAITTQALVNGVPTTLIPDIKYVGNGGQPFKRSDLNFDNVINGNDWIVFRNNNLVSLDPNLSDAQTAALGDLNGDGVSNFLDFRVFQADFDAANGVGAFTALVGAVPEPSSVALGLSAVSALLLSGRASRRRTTA